MTGIRECLSTSAGFPRLLADSNVEVPLVQLLPFSKLKANLPLAVRAVATLALALALRRLGPDSDSDSELWGPANHWHGAIRLQVGLGV
jgi:hypothetical protein